MRAAELMIGDWVNFLIDIEGGDTEYDQEVAQYQPMQIVSIACWRNNDGEVESAEGVINDIDQVKPIPLTPEILAKNFPEYEEGETIGWCKSGDFYEVVFKNNNIELNIQNVKHVHELQHIVRLCGIDKEIEI